MALNSIIRRATTFAPLAIRAAVGSSRTFHGAALASASGGRILSREINRATVSSLLRFSSAVVAKSKSSDENLVRVLETEINCEIEEAPQQDAVEDLPEDFPFEIQDTPRERSVLLKRKFGEESIQVEVDMLTPYDEEGGENENDQDDEDAGDRTRIPMVVNISKDGGLCIELGVSAYPDEIVIDSLSIKRPEGSEDQLAYEGPDFDDLDENLQKAFHKYLEVRGIKPSTTNFLIEYMANKDSREYLQWLKDLKQFIEK